VSSRRAALAAAAGVALALAPPAWAHGSIRPTAAAPGSTDEFVLLVANARADANMVAFTVDLPEGATLVEAGQRQPEWIVSSTADRVEWRCGPIPARAFETFTLQATMPDREGTADFVGTEIYEDGPGPPFTLAVVLAGSSAAAASDVTDEGARTLGKAALFVSIAALILGAAGLVLSLVRWRRDRPGS
jgi:uncharacterized protein YcnI